MNINEIISKELEYQQKQLKLIPSENYTSPEVMKAVGSVLMNKYAEGQAGKRYYQGNMNIDVVENICKERALKLFKLDPNKWHVNVQSVTGSVANLAVYNSVLEPGEKIMGMYLPHGGHLSHGWKLPDGKKVSFTSKVYQTDYYYVSEKTHTFDYNEVEKRVNEYKPKVLISGGTAYSRTIDHKKLSELAHNVGAYYLADVAHEAGLIAGESHPSPFPYADFVTMTSRKTLRGPIGALVFCRKEFADELDRSVFPGLQGGPMINSIAGIAVALEEAMKPEFKEYTRQIVKNAQKLSEELIKLGYNVVTGGTDKHLFLIDVRGKQKDGHIAALLLEAADIIVNKNTIPFDEDSTPWRPSGLRMGTPSVTTRGMKESEMIKIAQYINEVLSVKGIEEDSKTDEIKELASKNDVVMKVKKQVHKLTKRFPIYENLK
ncbi:MAG: serine hydroxymethyltransferase [bacterium]